MFQVVVTNLTVALPEGPFLLALFDPALVPEVWLSVAASLFLLLIRFK